MSRVLASVNPKGEDEKGEPFDVRIALEAEAGSFAVTASWQAKGALFNKLKKQVRDADFKWKNKEWIRAFKEEKEARTAYEAIVGKLPEPVKEAAAAAPAAAPADEAPAAAEAAPEAARLEAFEASREGMSVRVVLERAGGELVLRAGWELEKQWTLFRQLKELVKGAGFGFSFKSKTWSKGFKDEAPAREAFRALVEGMPREVRDAAPGGGAKRGREEAAGSGEARRAKRRSSGRKAAGEGGEEEAADEDEGEDG